MEPGNCRTKRMVTMAGGALIGTAAAVAAGNLVWDRTTEAAVRRLTAEAPAMPMERFSLDDLDGLPAPVARYFAFALPEGQAIIHEARIEQAGAFRIGGPRSPWFPFTALQHVAAEPPGFVWDARIRVALCLTIRVRDSYLGGAGAMQGRLLSLVPVVEQAGTPELAAGALQRYLAEAVWLPTALLPRQGVRWEAIDDKTARATFTDGNTTVSLEYRFGEQGEVVSIYTPSRYRDVGGAAVPTPWACHLGDYARVNGVMVPLRAEVEWILPEGPLPYFRGRLNHIHYGTSP